VKPFFGYIRVSTVKQGTKGVSLQEQRDSIVRYASRNGLEIISWFEERETAAKQGRPTFNKMMKLLRQEKARGVVLHKIDRGARNLKDWADMAALIDVGIEVHFANESLDMHTRGGRLSADIQAVVAADYIRNLREETLKGFYGRIKQGVYPLPAPLGYLDKGSGKPKEPDPMKAPLVRKAFELYATGRYNLDTLGAELHQLGLRNKKGNRVNRSCLGKLLNNPFYIGLIRIKSSGQTFPGVHAPLIPKSLFDRVKIILSGKGNTSIQKHNFLFRRLLRCRECGFTLVGERQKGHHYYRCHSKDCSATCIREELIDTEIQRQLVPLCFDDDERAYFRVKLAQLKTNWASRQEDFGKALNLQINQLKDRLNRLTDAFLDGAIDRIVFEQRKTALLMDLKGLEENMANLRDRTQAEPDHLSEFLELAGNAWLSYTMGIVEEKRDLLKIATSNRELDGKNVVIEPSVPFYEVANRFILFNGGPKRDIPRTWDRLLDRLAQLAKQGLLPTLKEGAICDGQTENLYSDNLKKPPI
jgi:DNA invertase Pin-like site-specific DNA recombinase